MDFFNDKEKEMIQKCISGPERFKIYVDNDNLSVSDSEDEDFDFSFNSYGYYFAYALLKHLGCSVEYV